MEFFYGKVLLRQNAKADDDAESSEKDGFHILGILNGIFLMARSSSGRMPKLMMTLSLVRKTASTSWVFLMEFFLWQGPLAAECRS
jgi:hypothetical protein